ncbi:MAG TPA: hypothetical protein PK416_08870 [Thermodesulfobacteriota bacterium]|nr:hypothetical protein [Thermodesulfobacteriota bacterium]
MKKNRWSFEAPILLLILLVLTIVRVLPAGAQEDLINQLTPQDWGDWVVVMLTIGVAQLVKMLLPSPDGVPRWAAVVTDRVNRVMPYIPIAIAAGLYVLWTRGAVVPGEDGPLPTAPIGQLIEHGAALGIYAAYLYRAGKVTIFGA